MMEARGVSVRAGARALLRAVDLTARAGAITALLGPNGAGKSTLLAALAGARALAAGRCLLDGRDVAEWPPIELARRRAVLTQSPQVSLAFTGREIAALGRWPHHGGRPGRADRGLADHALALVGAAALAERPVTVLSGGERQRVHLARALCQLMDPSGSLPAGAFLLLDEPTSDLDPAHALALLERLRALAAAGLGILWVAHDLALVARYADEAALLRDGRLLAAGRPEDVLAPGPLSLAFDLEVVMMPHPGGGRPVPLPVGPRSPRAPQPEQQELP